MIWHFLPTHLQKRNRGILNLVKVSFESQFSLSTHTDCNIIAGDAIVRELDVSKITLRIKEKQDKNGGDEDSENTIAKMSGSTLDTLQRCLVSSG